MSSGTVELPLRGTAEQNGGGALADKAARQDALDTSRSFLVQAPAGSGKTELLTRRFLALLSEVEEPEQILAITFTRAATAEMRARVIKALGAAQSGESKGTVVGELATRALQRGERMGWHLLEQPQRLNIQTIDSLCLRIAHQAPLLSRLGGRLVPTEDAAPFYQMAARRTMELLGSEREPEIATALQAILRLRDTSLADCEDLIANMLQRRDQWLSLFPAGQSSDADWAEVRAALEAPLATEHARVLGRARAVFEREPELLGEVLRLAKHACSFAGDHDYSSLMNVSELDHLHHARHWCCVCDLLLTAENDFRRVLNRRHGFPTQRDGGDPLINALLKGFLNRLPEVRGLLEALCAVRSLPAERFTDEQWMLVRHILIMLLRAVAELRVVFAEKGEVDFAEIGLAARNALRDKELAGQRSEELRHILVDEFQDTSRPQHELLAQLISEWQPGDGRTCFLVGDPMQSIYLFRQAEVELFGEARRHGLALEGGSSFSLTPLTLQTNFRSTPAVVNTLNEVFARVFETSGSGITFSASVAAPTEAKPVVSPEKAVRVLPDYAEAREGETESAAKLAARRREAEETLRILEAHRERLAESERQGRAYTIAVLVRARSHLFLIAEDLRRAGLRFRSVEIETLGERQEVLDLLSLVRALTHPMDRIAWLSVLRAPWCGLALEDLHALCGDEVGPGAGRPLLALLSERLERLSPASRARAARILAAMTAALEARGRGMLGASPVGFATWIEQTWRALGGPQCLTPEALGNTVIFFQMLGQLPPDGRAAADGELAQRLERLFAQPDPETSESHGIQLLTMHKSKGMEFDVVIAPGLDRPSARDTASLLCWMTRTNESGRREVLLAPIGRRGAPGRVRLPGDLYRWVRAQKDRQAREEQQRLLYVACTRAKSELYLLGATGVKRQTGDAPLLKPSTNSLLGTLWPYAEEIFTQGWHTRTQSPAQPAYEESIRESVFHEARQPSVQSLLPFPSFEPETGAGVVLRMAAAAPGPNEHKYPSLQRLPANWHWTPEDTNVIASVAAQHLPAAAMTDGPAGEGLLAPHHPGSRETRIRGVVIHALLEQLSRILTANAEITFVAGRWRAVAAALLRNQGLGGSAHTGLLAEVMDALERTVADPIGRWLLGGHREARSEVAWANAAGETMRADRIFLAGAEPGTPGSTCLWIVDYKTASPADGRPLSQFLAEEWQQHAAQLARYGEALRHIYPEHVQRWGLYYPLLGKLDSREPQGSE